MDFQKDIYDFKIDKDLILLLSLKDSWFFFYFLYHVREKFEDLQY